MSSVTKSKLLNAKELIAVTNLQNEIEATVLVRGLKATYPKNTDEERATITSYQDDLRKVLSLERVVQKGSRSVASFENGIIQIIKRTGKWEGFESTGTFLEPHEALFLMETNRLEVYMGKMIVSLERAYHLFLAHDNTSDGTKLTKMEYLVYSHFIRFGCNLKRFKNEMPPTKCDDCSDNSSSDSDSNMDNNTPDDRLYVWNYLYDLLGHRRSILASENIDRNRYTRIKQSMNNIIGKYKNQNQTNSCQSNQIVSDTNASGENTEPPEKKRRKHLDSSGSMAESATKLPESDCKNVADDLYFGSGSLNDFMIGSSFQRFKQIFDKIDIIELKTMDYDDDDQHNGNNNMIKGDSSQNHRLTTEKFSFDLWTSWDSRRSHQATKPPNFRLIIKQPSKSLPHNDDIFTLYRSLIRKSAIIVVCINEEMSFQAYVYRFTTQQHRNCQNLFVTDMNLMMKNK